MLHHYTYKVKEGKEEQYLISEYFHGQSLEDILKERISEGKEVEEAELLYWTAMILLALLHAHRQEIVHRNLSSRHIIFNEKLRVFKVINFSNESYKE